MGQKSVDELVAEYKKMAAAGRLVAPFASENDYNWDHGKSVDIPGWGRIDDKEAIRVERAGKAKSYHIESNWWKVTRRDIVGDANVTVP